MSVAQDNGPYAHIVRRAMADIVTNHRFGDAPGWDALGIDAAFLAKAGKHALNEDDRILLQRDALRARIHVLVHGGPDEALLATAPPSMREAVARRLIEGRMAIARVRRAFVDRGPPIRPLLLNALRHAGIDAAAACMVTAANRWRSDIPLLWRHELPLHHGTARLIPLDTDRNGDLPDGAIEGEIRVGVDLAPRIRLTTSSDMRIWLVTPPVPETIASHLVGRRLGDVVRHAALPADARIIETTTLGEVSTGEDNPDDLVILFESRDEPRTWRGCDPDSFAPIRGG